MSVRFGLRLAVACLAVFTFGKPGNAEIKVAIVNLQKAVLETAEIKKASADMETKYKPRQQEMEKLQRELQGIQQQLQTNASKLTAAAEADLTAQGQLKQRELQRMSEDMQADVTADRNEILSQSSKKMAEVVRKLADEKGFDVVIDVQSTVFFKPALEITTDAIAAYDKTYPAK